MAATDLTFPTGRLVPPPRAQSRMRAIARFRWAIRAPLIALFVVLILPVLFLQLYFSLHSWTVYLGSWWEADFVGLELFRDVFSDRRFGAAVVRSLTFAIGSTLGCFLIGFGLALLMYRPFAGQSLYYIGFILPMLTVPIVIAYTAEMLLYQNGPINDLLSRVSGRNVNILWLANPDVALLT
ncbi:MAG TPA: hypothetical protein VET25_00380, partial [Aestuariivirgaceae bacterium]|nr:hypothetical protein [Aestuariivirgaceae bacterium]